LYHFEDIRHDWVLVVLPGNKVQSNLMRKLNKANSGRSALEVRVWQDGDAEAFCYEAEDGGSEVGFKPRFGIEIILLKNMQEGFNVAVVPIGEWRQNKRLFF
jgi:hypothetical protein